MSGHECGRGRRSEAGLEGGFAVNEDNTGCFDPERWRAERFCKMFGSADISALLGPLQVKDKSCLCVFDQCVPYVAAVMQCNIAFRIRKEQQHQCGKIALTFLTIRIGDE